MLPEPARVIETVFPGAAVPVIVSVLSAVTPSPGVPVSFEMARIDGVAIAVLTVDGAEAALVLPARSVTVTVKEWGAGGSGGPATLRVHRPAASATAAPIGPLPASVAVIVPPASAVPRNTRPGSAATVSIMGGAGTVVSTVTRNRGESGPVVPVASVAAATNVETPSGSAVPA